MKVLFWHHMWCGEMALNNFFPDLFLLADDRWRVSKPFITPLYSCKGVLGSSVLSFWDSFHDA